MNITQFLELQAIGIAGGAIHKTIAMLRHVTTRVRDKKKLIGNASVLKNIKQLAYKDTCIERASEKRLNNPKWITMDGKNLNMIPSPL